MGFTQNSHGIHEANPKLKTVTSRQAPTYHTPTALQHNERPRPLGSSEPRQPRIFPSRFGGTPILAPLLGELLLRMVPSSLFSAQSGLGIHDRVSQSRAPLRSHNVRDRSSRLYPSHSPVSISRGDLSRRFTLVLDPRRTTKGAALSRSTRRGWLSDR